MEQSTFAAPQKPSVEQPRAHSTGPVEIDPRLFCLVSGGAPRDGIWATTAAAPRTTTLG